MVIDSGLKDGFVGSAIIGNCCDIEWRKWLRYVCGE